MELKALAFLISIMRLDSYVVTTLEYFTLTTLVFFTYTPLARCDYKVMGDLAGTYVSTHTPLARCDPDGVRIRTRALRFYSHTSCEV